MTCHQKRSEAIRGNLDVRGARGQTEETCSQKQSEAVRSSQKQSEAVRSYQKQSEAVRSYQKLSGAISMTCSRHAIETPMALDAARMSTARGERHAPGIAPGIAPG